MTPAEIVLIARDVVVIALRLYYFLVIASILMTWMRPDPRNVVVRWIHRLTDPSLMLARRLLPFLQAGVIDFSPIAVILLIELASQLVSRIAEKIAIAVG